MPFSDHAVLLKTTAHHDRRETAMLFCGLEKKGMFRAWHGRGVASVNQTRLHYVNRMGKTYSKPLAPRHGRGSAWARHAMCESALTVAFKLDSAGAEHSEIGRVAAVCVTKAFGGLEV